MQGANLGQLGPKFAPFLFDNSHDKRLLIGGCFSTHLSFTVEIRIFKIKDKSERFTD